MRAPPIFNPYHFLTHVCFVTWKNLEGVHQTQLMGHVLSVLPARSTSTSKLFPTSSCGTEWIGRGFLLPLTNDCNILGPQIAGFLGNQNEES